MKNGADVMLPEGHEIAALDRLLQLHQTQSLLDRPLQAIDMRLGDRLVVRPKGDAKNDARGEIQPGSGPQTAPPAVTPIIAKKPT